MTKPARDAFVVPSGRLSRLARLGSLASGVAGAALTEGVRQFAQGRRPRLGDLLLTPGNARRVAEQLAQLRGAAMKVGQLLSMDAGDLLPRDLAEIMGRLRSDARPMPMSQLVEVLDGAWGEGWDRRFARFSFTPIAAASIGQVHEAWTRDGRRLAIKVQYPGVRRSISSDVDNVATLLRISGLLPRSFDVAPLLDEAKRQLHEEADYVKEGAQLARFRDLLADRADFVLPEVDVELTRADVLAMSFAEGEPIESVQGAPGHERDRVARLLFELLFGEIFEFRRVQTDPNFANYLYQAGPGRLVLLDFGATREYAAPLVESYRRLLTAGMHGDGAAVGAAAAQIGYFPPGLPDARRRMVVDVFLEACEPFRHDGPYDFGRSDLGERIRDAGLRLGADREFWHTPPADALFLHRKIGGLYLLAARLRARVDIRAAFLPHAGGRGRAGRPG